MCINNHHQYYTTATLYMDCPCDFWTHLSRHIIFHPVGYSSSSQYWCSLGIRKEVFDPKALGSCKYHCYDQVLLSHCSGALHNSKWGVSDSELAGFYLDHKCFDQAHFCTSFQVGWKGKIRRTSLADLRPNSYLY